MKRPGLRVSTRERLALYADRSSIHGVSYTLDPALSRPDRLLWLLLLAAALTLAGYMISMTLIDWQQEPTITTLQSVSKPVEGNIFVEFYKLIS